MSRATKRVLIEQAELDRLQQRQLRDYSPELHSMAALHRQTMDVLSRKDLDEGGKLRMLSSIDARFNQLKRETNTLGSKTAVKAPVADAVEPDAAEPEVAPVAAPAVDEKPADANVPAAPFDLRKIGLHPQVRDKASKLLLQISANPDVLTRNAAGELVLYGEPVHGSDFDAIFTAAFTANKMPDLPGTESFFRGLRTLNVRKSALSSRHFVKAFAATPPHGGPLRHGALLLEEDEESEPKRARVTQAGAKAKDQGWHDDVMPMSPPIKPRSKQTGKGLRKRLPQPPGTRANVLYVY